MTFGEASEHCLADAGAEGAPVTVIMPVYGPGAHLEQAISALRRQSPPVGRIIVSHSGDGDPTARFAGLPDVTVLHSPDRLFAGAARNRAMALAETDWVAFIDEDVIVDEGWHAALLAAIARGQADCIVGAIGFAETGGYWGMCVWFVEFGPVHPYRNGGPIFAGASANMAARRHDFESTGGFPEDWPRGQDTVAQSRLRAAGHRIWFDPAPRGNHINLPGLRRMLHHLYVTGGYSARLRRAYPESPGALAVRYPILSLGLWPARFAQTCGRVLLASNAPVISLLLHSPGIAIGLLAWSVGFVKEAFASGWGARDHDGR